MRRHRPGPPKRFPKTTERAIVRALERGSSAYLVAAQRSCSVKTICRIAAAAGCRFLAYARTLDFSPAHLRQRVSFAREHVKARTKFAQVANATTLRNCLFRSYPALGAPRFVPMLRWAHHVFVCSSRFRIVTSSASESRCFAQWVFSDECRVQLGGRQGGRGGWTTGARRRPNTAAQLESACKREWRALISDAALLRNLYRSMPVRMQVVVDRKGDLCGY